MLSINEDEYFKIEISVREALNNAIVHGNHMDFQKKVFVDYTWDRAQLRVIIRDENNDFIDFRNIEEKLRSREILSCSGRGFMIMKNYMDKVEFNCLDRGSEIILEKRLA
jgi:anti-sigma regulatory factor (Ser/Thr protein kinase)